MTIEQQLKKYMNKIIKIIWNTDDTDQGLLVIEENERAFDPKDGRHYYTLMEYRGVKSVPIWFHPEHVKSIEYIGEKDERLELKKYIKREKNHPKNGKTGNRKQR